MGSDRWRQMNEIFQQAVERPPEDREPFLRAACGSDDQLRRAVEVLLAAEQKVGGFLEEPLILRPAADSEHREFRHQATQPEDTEVARLGADELVSEGRQIGPYRLLRQIGEGGMGTVFLALRDDETFRRQVAVKVLRRGRENEETRRRLRAERQILAGLEHTYIARLYDGGTTEDGLPYLVMEYVDGLPIDRYCDHHRLPVRERISLFRKVCEAVDYAHRNLIVHRDLKPTNILVTADGEPKLLDFGIAKLLDARPVLAGSEPTTGLLRLLTPHYASPEQVRGQRVTTVSDVYSLGVVLYELLSGRLPHRFQGQSLLEIERALIERVPTRPSLAIAREPDGGAPEDPAKSDPTAIAAARSTGAERLSRQLRGDLDHIVLKALRSDPRQRYRSAGQLSEDLERAQKGFPVMARKGKADYRLTRFARRNRATVAAAALFMIVILGFAADRALHSARLAGALAQTEQERDEKQQVIQLVVDIFRSADPTRSRGAQLTVREALDQIEIVERPQARIPEGVEATLRQTVGQIYFHLDALDPARAQFEKVLKIRRQLHGDESIETAKSLSDLGAVLSDTGDNDEEAEALLREAIARIRRIAGSDPADLVGALNRLVTLMCYQGAYSAAGEPSVEALELARKHTGRVNDEEVAVAVINRATVLKNREGASASSDDLEQAQRLFREAVTIYQDLLGEVHPDVASAVNNLADLTDRLGNQEEALRLHRRALEIRRQLFPEGHTHVAQSLNHLGKILQSQGDYEAAEERFRDALQLLIEIRGPDKYVTTRPAVGLASALILQRRYTEAEELLRKSLDVRERMGAGQSEVAAKLIELYEAWGRPEEASAYRALMASEP